MNVDELIELANDFHSSPEDLAEAAGQTNRALADAPSEAQIEALQSLCPVLLEHPDSRKLGPLATICGAIVERDFPYQPLAKVVQKRLPDLLQLAAQFHEVWKQQVQEQGIRHPTELDTESEEELEEAFEKYYSPAGHLMNIMPEAGAAWDGLQTFWPACIALFSKDHETRQQMRQYRALAENIAQEHEGGYWISQMLQVRHAEPVLVLHPKEGAGFIGTISGIADNFQLQMFLMDVWKPNKSGWLGKIFSPAPLAPELSDLIRGEGPQQINREVTGRWNMLSWKALNSDGQLENDGVDNPDHWIWNEGTPADIPTFEGHRVILLAPPTYSRSWNACRLFPKLSADISIEKWLSAEEVHEWLQKLSAANK